MEEKKNNRPSPSAGNATNQSMKININKTAKQAPDQNAKPTVEQAIRPNVGQAVKSTASQAAHRPSARSMDFARPATAKPTSVNATQPTVHKAVSARSLHQQATTHTGSSTKKKATTKPANRQTFVFVACAILAVCVVALITWGVTSLLPKKITEETTFVTDDTQTTITIEPTESEHSSISHTRTVYEYDSDNNVIGMKTYFEYADNEAAKAAYETVKDQPEFKGAEVIDKYIVVAADPNSFKGLTAEDVRQQSENLERYYQTHKKSDSAQEAPAPQPEENPEPTPEDHPEDHFEDHPRPDEE